MCDIAGTPYFFFQAEDGIRDWSVTGVQTCALPICAIRRPRPCPRSSLLFGAALAALAPTARGQLAPTTRVDVDSAGTESNSFSMDPSKIGRASCRERG